jgi:glycosyl transferase family 25
MRGGEIASRMTAGEVGCYASHLLTYRSILRDGHEAAVVLEDDCVLDDDFDQVVANAIETATGAWDIIHLTSTRESFPMAALGGGRHLVRYARLPVRAAAYAISRQGAKKLLRPYERQRPIDMEFRYAWVAGLDILGVAPPPVTPLDNIVSTIDPTSMDRERCRNYWAPSIASRIAGKITTKLKLGLIGTLATWIQYAFNGRPRSVFPRWANLHSRHST